MPTIKKIRHITKKRKNSNLAIPAAATPIPVNPKKRRHECDYKKIEANVASFRLLKEESHRSTTARFFYANKSEDAAKYVLCVMSTILLIILILLLIGALPAWPYSRGWSYYPSGGLGLILLIVVILALLGTI
jgi:hypothetical protein